MAPRIIVLFVLDRGYLSVRGVFCFTPYGKRIIREVKQNEIWFFCKNWGLIWLPLTRVTPHGVGRCHEVTEGTAAVSGWHAAGVTGGVFLVRPRANTVRPYEVCALPVGLCKIQLCSGRRGAGVRWTPLSEA